MQSSVGLVEVFPSSSLGYFLEFLEELEAYFDFSFSPGVSNLVGHDLDFQSFHGQSKLLALDYRIIIRIEQSGQAMKGEVDLVIFDAPSMVEEIHPGVGVISQCESRELYAGVVIDQTEQDQSRLEIAWFVLIVNQFRFIANGTIIVKIVLLCHGAIELVDLVWPACFPTDIRLDIC